MHEQAGDLIGQIKTWVVNDYFTPNIKAEVILDTLLTPYVAEIINSQCGLDTALVTKEMSVYEQMEQNSTYGNMGTKIDYILANRKAVYLAELKTTDSSIDTTQADRYLVNCKGRTFGGVFGQKLLKIIRSSFGKTYEKDFIQCCGEDSDSWDGNSLSKAFHLVFRNQHLGAKYRIADPSHGYAGAAMELIKTAGWAQSDDLRSRKYLYTMGQLMDYMYPDDGETRPLWDLPLKLLYLTPAGTLPHKEFEQKTPDSGEDFYLHPMGKGSVSLIDAGKYLSEKQGDELARLLAKIIKELYKIEDSKCQN